MKTHYSVIVVSNRTGTILAEYSFERKSEAQEAMRNIKEIRVKQNHEDVRILLQTIRNFS